MKKYIVLVFLILSTTLVYSQHNVKYSAIDIQLALQKLKVLGSVLYIAAHPDDENQSLLTYMAKDRLFRSAYLSLTRGDGGQNLLGPEKGALLGVLRTQELLAARQIDGAQQYFTRAIDFGYSKTSKETLQKWDREKILGDVIKVIRTFRPDVIITRFSESNGGHGHHLSSAILATEAFYAAADPEKYPEQLTLLEPWQPKRIFWNTWQPDQERPNDAPPVLELNFGEYNKLLGMSYREIAAKSRTMHKSQGFGNSPFRGETLDYYQHTAGDTATSDLFDGIETSWLRVKNSNEIRSLVKKINDEFDHDNPTASLKNLIKLNGILDKQKSFWVEIKKAEVQELIRMCSGLWLESIALNEYVTPGSNAKIRTTVLNRSSAEISLKSISTSFSVDTTLDQLLQNNIPYSIMQDFQIPVDVSLTQPFWLENSASETMYNISDEAFNGRPQNLPALTTQIILKVYGQEFTYNIPVEYRWNDPTAGEQYKPFTVQPDVSIVLPEDAYIFASTEPKNITVTIKAAKDSTWGNLIPTVPDNWLITPTGIHFAFDKKDEQRTFNFAIQPVKNATDGILSFQAETNGRKFNQQLIKLNYDHIPEQTVLVPAMAKLVKLDITVPKKHIAYIMGSGDEIPDALAQIGISTTLISDEQLATIDYSNFDAVICGIRAFNTRTPLGIQQKRIMDYVQMGGTWIVQHNTRFGNQIKQIGPYPFVARGRSRISEEDAVMQLLQPAHQIFNYPNKINPSDFDGWVQERGTYMAESWEGKLYPLLAGNDSGEAAQLGGLLYAPYGKGVFIFTGLSWFRQLPAGVPGAYRLFVNMICSGDKVDIGKK